MKISIGMNLHDGPWGGGNQAMKALGNFLTARDHEVFFDLNPKDLDLILLVEPRPFAISAYNEKKIFKYLSRVNPQALVVHRVNECDERKNTNHVNKILRRANLCADHTVFVSDWLKGVHNGHGWPCKNQSVILNGSDAAIFNPQGYRSWDGNEPMRLVTHHWSGNWRKGFDIYSRLDQHLAQPEYQKRFSFTYIGNLPEGFAFRNSRYVEPISGKQLADTLKEHHVYLTASLNEPGSNHQNEGALCGLPLFYLDNASMPEYCRGFGLAYSADNFEQKLEVLTQEYASLLNPIKGYPHNADQMCTQYLELFEKVCAQKDELIQARDPRRVMRWRMQALKARLGL